MSTQPSTTELSNLESESGGGFVINGVDVSDNSGFSVSAAGDVNGDGLDDVIIGSPLADPNGSSSGSSYVVFGTESTDAIELSTLEAGEGGGFVINGVDTADYSGYSVSAAGDVNGDGLDDVIIGAYTADPNNSGAGASYVVFGTESTNAIELSILEEEGGGGFVINGVFSAD